VHDENPSRLKLSEVELNKNYAIVLSTNAGLWAYSIGDLVRFTSLQPYRIVVSGRIKHYTSAFGEHVIAEEVERAIKNASEQSKVSVYEFHLAPEVEPKEGLPYHEWFIEMDEIEDLGHFAKALDQEMQKQNPYYKDLINGKVLQPLKIKRLPKGSFQLYMKSQGKLGGQNKLPRLANDRKIAAQLSKN